MMNVYINPPRDQWDKLLARPLIPIEELEKSVAPLLQAVKQEGDEALIRFTERFDKVSVKNMRLSQAEITKAQGQIGESLKAAIQTAKHNIERFHQAQHEVSKQIETMPGVVCWRKSVGIPAVGLYIPGGTAPLFSTILMLGIPAALAGCQRRVLCSPPNTKGELDPAIVYTASLLGIEEIYKVGGAQAIAAMAYGTESIAAVDKIFGPGNQYVTIAKQLVNKEGIAIDMPAGPSEVLVYADHTSEPAFVAADLLSQAEHGRDSQVVLVATQKSMVENVQKQLALQMELLPRKEVARAALSNSRAFVINKVSIAIDLINRYAPEHLILSIDETDAIADQIINAGSVFLGHFTPESVGDYASGTNHTLPTNGFAKAYSGVSLDSFVKKITFQRLSKTGLKTLGPTVELMAAAEGLQGHKQAVSIRLAKFQSK